MKGRWCHVVTSAVDKAGKGHRTGDIQIGNGGQSSEFPVEKAMFCIDPSTLCAGIDDFRQLQTMLGTWSLVGQGARLTFLGLLVRMLEKLPVSPAQSETQPFSAQPLPTAPPPSPETGREDVQSIVVRRDRPSEITSSSPSSEIALRDDDGDDEDAEEEDEDEAVEEPKPTARSVLKRLNISLHPEKRKYYVRVFRHGKTHWAGYFVSPEEAADAAVKLREKLGLPFFPVWLRKPPKPE